MGEAPVGLASRHCLIFKINSCCFDREAGDSADELAWDNSSGQELEDWAKEKGYFDEIMKAKGA